MCCLPFQTLSKQENLPKLQGSSLPLISEEIQEKAVLWSPSKPG